MSTPTGTGIEPNTPAQASLYQQLRGHLAALKLHTAAEHLPNVLDRAAAEKLSLTAALERAAMAAFTTDPPHRRKQRIPPGPAARAAAAAVRAGHSAPASSTSDISTGELGAEVVVDLTRYAAAAQGRNTLR